jgi:hypothetical protein
VAEPVTRPKLVVVVKSYPPPPRVSGIIGFLTVLIRHLAPSVEVHVVSYDTERSGGRTSVVDGD